METDTRRCGVETRAGKQCQQRTEFFPCQWHDKVQYARRLRPILTGEAVLCGLCPHCGNYYPLLMGAHVCRREN
jgi:hypothetical protein